MLVVVMKLITISGAQNNSAALRRWIRTIVRVSATNAFGEGLAKLRSIRSMAGSNKCMSADRFARVINVTSTPSRIHALASVDTTRSAPPPSRDEMTSAIFNLLHRRQ